MASAFFKVCLQAAICVVLLSLVNTASESCPNIFEREQWGARRWKDVNYLVTPLLYVVIHHTVTPECDNFSDCVKQLKGIQNFHMDDLKWDDIGYSFMVGGDGSIYEGTGWTMEGSHTYGYNKKSIAIAFIGNFQLSFRNSTFAVSVEKDVTEASLKAAHDLINCGKTQGYLRQNVKVIAARQVTSTASPGDLLYEKIKRWSEWTSIVTG